MTNERIAVLGGKGFVGPKIAEMADVISPSRNDVDITSREQVERWMQNFESDVVVLAAAYTNTKDAQNNISNVRKLMLLVQKLLQKQLKNLVNI